MTEDKQFNIDLKKSALIMQQVTVGNIAFVL